MIAPALKYTSLFALVIVVFFASFSHGAEETDPPCIVNEDGFFGENVDMTKEPVYNIMNVHYEVEYDEGANFDEILAQLEVAMLETFLATSDLVYQECHPSSPERRRDLQDSSDVTLDDVKPTINHVPWSDVKPSFSTRPIDEWLSQFECVRKSPKGKKCRFMGSVMTMYYDLEDEDMYLDHNKFMHINTSFHRAIIAAADRGDFSKIDGISYVKGYTDREYRAIFLEEGGGGRSSLIFPLVAGSVTIGTLLFGTALLQIRRKFQPKQENTFEGRVQSETNVV